MSRKIGLLLAAAAAYGVYRYAGLSKAEKSELMQKGKDFLNKNLGSLNEIINKTKVESQQNG